jgi:hypothetical protein
LLSTGDCCSFAYSAFASSRMGMSGSASFQSVRKSWYELLAYVLPPTQNSILFNAEFFVLRWLQGIPSDHPCSPEIADQHYVILWCATTHNEPFAVS